MLLGTARDYSSNFNYPFLVLPNWFTLGKNVELYRTLNVSGVMMEASGGVSTPDLHEMRVYMVAQVRETPSWPRSWANFSLLPLYSHRNAWANLHLLGQPNTFLAAAVLPAVGQRHRDHARVPGRVLLAVDVKVILTPPCIFH